MSLRSHKFARPPCF